MPEQNAGRAGTTVVDLLERLFPPRQDGAVPYFAFPALTEEAEDEAGMPSPYATPPILPPDAFAAAAHLLDLSGAYHHVVPRLERRPPRARRLVLIEPADLRLARDVADAWRAYRPDLDFSGWIRGAGAPLARLHGWWSSIFSAAGGSPVYLPLPSDSEPPSWWKDAVMILMAADEAAMGVGFLARFNEDGRFGKDQPWTSFIVEGQMTRDLTNKTDAFETAVGDVDVLSGASSLSTADPDVVNVLPKSRTAAVGCTLRSLSHHLALLPPRGVARASWTPYLFRKPPSDEQHMNLLLVPFPFSVPANAFKATGHNDGDDVSWGFFDVEQTWLRNVTPSHFVDFVAALASEAKRECDGIHGVVLPELALDEAHHSELSRRLPEILPEVELLVSGHSGDPGRRLGNFVAVTVYQRDAEGEAAGRGVLTHREKHHRWKLDRAQVVDYGLEGRLSPSLDWWEDIDLLSRRVDFSVFRSGSVLSAMICEDLARVDPCQELIRAIGPSIVFALLMDAPQMRVRWPARYATVLADDPGSAVLTLTSRALMTRQNRLGIHASKDDRDRVVALWKDDTGQSEEIACPLGTHAVRLTLSGRKTTDATLDGRDDRSAVSWRYAAQKPVRLKDVVGPFADVLGEDDLAETRRRIVP